MGTGCSSFCTRCVNKVCCCCPCCKEDSTPPRRKSNKATSPIARLLRTVATSTIKTSLRSIAISPMPQPLSEDAWEIRVIQAERMDLSSLHQIAQDVNFSDIVNAAILLAIDARTGPAQKPKVVPQNCPDWHDKYFVHGRLSDIVADVKGQTHGCISSSISEDIDTNLGILHDINIKADVILQERLAKIASKEKSSINRFIQERDNLIDTLLKKGRSYVNQYEEEYRRLIQRFITKLEEQISNHLEYLQNELEAGKESIFQEVNSNIQYITAQADSARSYFHQLLQQFVVMKRQEIMDRIDISSKNKTDQPLGYEQLRKLNVEVYSTVGLKKDDQGCDNIRERGKFIKDIEKVKPPHPRTRRTVYIEQNVDQQQATRNRN